MKYAYEKIKSFAHYKGLRDFKDKFSPEWKNEYLVYSHDFDLLQVPSSAAYQDCKLWSCDGLYR